MELLALEKHAVKDNADVARELKTPRAEIDDNGDSVVGSAAGSNDPSDPITWQRIVGSKLSRPVAKPYRTAPTWRWG